MTNKQFQIANRTVSQLQHTCTILKRYGTRLHNDQHMNVCNKTFSSSNTSENK